MRIEDHAPTIETCQRMTELGWEKDTVFSWITRENKIEYRLGIQNPYMIGSGEELPAPLATEIMEELPEEVQMCFVTVFGKGKTVKQFNCTHLYGVTITGSGLKYNESDFTDPNPAEALAQMWIYLKENDLLPTQPDDHE